MKKNQTVILKTDLGFLLGVITEEIYSDASSQNDEKKNVVAYRARVYDDGVLYTFLTKDVFPIENEDHFTTLRKNKEQIVQEQPARELASRVLDYFSFKGERYYTKEDQITKVIETFRTDY